MHEETGDPIEPITCKVVQTTILVEFKWARCSLGKPAWIEIIVSLFYVKIKSASLGNTNVVMRRLPHPEEIAENVPTAAKYKAALASRAKALTVEKRGNGAARGNNDHWQRICKHILF